LQRPTSRRRRSMRLRLNRSSPERHTFGCAAGLGGGHSRCFGGVTQGDFGPGGVVLASSERLVAVWQKSLLRCSTDTLSATFGARRVQPGDGCGRRRSRVSPCEAKWRGGLEDGFASADRFDGSWFAAREVGFGQLRGRRMGCCVQASAEHVGSSGRVVCFRRELRFGSRVGRLECELRDRPFGDDQRTGKPERAARNT